MAIVIVKYLHLLGILLFVAVLFHQLVALRTARTRAAIAGIARIGIIGHVAALLVLISGFAIWFGWFGQSKWGTELYMKNPILHSKVTLFVLVLLAIGYPAIKLKKLRSGEPEEEVAVPGSLRLVLLLQLLAMLAMPVMGLLISEGVGFRR